MNFITNLWLAFNAYTHSNPVIAGAMSLWGLTVVSLVFRKIPAKLLSKIYGQLTTTLTFDNTELGWARENYSSFMTWFMKNGWSRYSRNMSLQSFGPHLFDRMYHNTDPHNRNSADVVIGNGGHFFFYKRRLFLMNRHTLEKQGRDNIIYVVTLTMFGRNKAIMSELVNEFCHKFDETKLKLMRFKADYWEEYATIDRRELKTVIVEKKLKDQLIQSIERFRQNEAWYVERGLPYKETVVLHGEPGTGKTSLIKGVASHFGMNVCRLSLTALTDETLEAALSRLPKNSILAIEDFDSAKATHRRSGMKRSEPNELRVPVRWDGKGELSMGTPTSNTTDRAMVHGEALTNPMAQMLADMDPLTLSGILNALDGIASLHGTLIFLSTNTLAAIDPALLRKGRVDHTYEIKRLTHVEVLDYIELMYPGRSSEPTECFSDILGCDLQALYFEHHDDFDQFIAAIPKQGDLRDTLRQIDALIKAA